MLRTGGLLAGGHNPLVGSRLRPLMVKASYTDREDTVNGFTRLTNSSRPLRPLGSWTRRGPSLCLFREYVDSDNMDRVHTTLRDSTAGPPAVCRPLAKAEVVGTYKVGGLHHRHKWPGAG